MPHLTADCRPCRLVALVLALAASLLLTACDQQQSPPPGEVIDENLEDAQQSMGNADEAMDQMQQKNEQIAEETQKLQEQAKEMVEKQTNFFGTQLEEYRERITRLPAEEEGEFRARLDELQGNLESLKQSLENYAGPDTAPDAWDRVSTEFDQTKAAFASFGEDLNEALP